MRAYSVIIVQEKRETLPKYITKHRNLLYFTFEVMVFTTELVALQDGGKTGRIRVIVCKIIHVRGARTSFM